MQEVLVPCDEIWSRRGILRRRARRIAGARELDEATRLCESSTTTPRRSASRGRRGAESAPSLFVIELTRPLAAPVTVA